jgi:hypothetical protein
MVVMEPITTTTEFALLVTLHVHSAAVPHQTSALSVWPPTTFKEAPPARVLVTLPITATLPTKHASHAITTAIRVRARTFSAPLVRVLTSLILYSTLVLKIALMAITQTTVSVANVLMAAVNALVRILQIARRVFPVSSSKALPATKNVRMAIIATLAQSKYIF